MALTPRKQTRRRKKKKLPKDDVYLQQQQVGLFTVELTFEHYMKCRNAQRPPLLPTIHLHRLYPNRTEDDSLCLNRIYRIAVGPNELIGRSPGKGRAENQGGESE